MIKLFARIDLSFNLLIYIKFFASQRIIGAFELKLKYGPKTLNPVARLIDSLKFASLLES